MSDLTFDSMDEPSKDSGATNWSPLLSNAGPGATVSVSGVRQTSTGPIPPTSAAFRSVAAQSMGAFPVGKGVGFRVWAPNAEAVSVVGSFNRWNNQANRLVREQTGCWYGLLDDAEPGDLYRYSIRNGNQTFERIDPRARQICHARQAAILTGSEFDWASDSDFDAAPINELVIRQVHVSGLRMDTDGSPCGTLDDLRARLPQLAHSGFNAIELAPLADASANPIWGFHTCFPFAVDDRYGGPEALKRCVRDAHQLGLAVLATVIYNHLGLENEGLWKFDGTGANGKGGIYFFEDAKSRTPWGDTRPDYTRAEVRSFIRDSATIWLDEYHFDGLRFDSTRLIHSVGKVASVNSSSAKGSSAKGSSLKGGGVKGAGDEIAEGWELTQWLNREIKQAHPTAITIAEDLQDNGYVTRSDVEGGAGFTAQWDNGLQEAIDQVATSANVAPGSLTILRDSLYHGYNNDAFQRVVYAGCSHPGSVPTCDCSTNRSQPPSSDALGQSCRDRRAKCQSMRLALMMTAPGIPMLMDMLMETYTGIDSTDGDRGHGRLLADLNLLRTSPNGKTRGLTGQIINVFHLNEEMRVMAFRRSASGGDGDDVVVVANFNSQPLIDYQIGFPDHGTWRVRLSTDSTAYHQGDENLPSADVQTCNQSADHQVASGRLSIGAYSVTIYSKD